MAAPGIPGLDVNDPFNPGNRQVPTGGSSQAANWRSERMANMGPQTPPGWAAPENTAPQPDKTMRWAQSVQQGAAKFAEGPRPNGITEGARGMATGIRDASAAGTRVGVDVAKGVARRVPLGGIAGVASEVLPHSGVYSGAGDMPWQDRLAVGATDLLAAGGGALGGMVGAGIGQVALPIPGVGAVAGGLTGGVAGAKAGRWLGDKMFSSGDALQRAGFDPDRGIVDIGRDVAGGKSLEDAMSPTMRAPIAPQQPAMPGQRGIGAVEGFRGEAPNSFGDGASGGFQTVPTWRNTGAAPTAPATFAGNAGGTFDNTQKFTPNQVAPTGPNLTGRAPETFAEGSDRGGGSISAPMAPAVPGALPPGESQTAAASFRSNPQGQPGGPSDPSIGPPPPTNPAGTIIRDGNSYSGTGNIKFGADIRNPDNSMRNGGDALSKGFGVSSLDFSEGRRQDALELQRLHSAPGLPQSVTTGDGGSTLGQGATGFGGNFSTGLRGRKADRANAAAMASMREQNENLRSQRQTDALMRGQDVAREGHILTNDAARIRLGYDMKRGERDFAAGRDDANFTQGQAAQKDIHSTIANMLPPIMVDGKPTADMAGAARHMEALSTHVSDRMGNLRQHLKLNPGDKQAASELAGLQARGVAMLPPDQVNKVVRGRMAADVATAAHTGMFNPFGGTAVNSNAPITSMRDDGNGNYVSDRGDVTPHRYFDKTDSILGFGGKRNLDFDTLKTMRSAR